MEPTYKMSFEMVDIDPQGNEHRQIIRFEGENREALNDLFRGINYIRNLKGWKEKTIKLLGE